MVTTLLVSVRTRDNPQPSPSFLEVVDEKLFTTIILGKRVQFRGQMSVGCEIMTVGMGLKFFVGHLLVA